MSEDNREYKVIDGKKYRVVKYSLSQELEYLEFLKLLRSISDNDVDEHYKEILESAELSGQQD